MSATNRGGQREPSDYYVTPQWAILQMLDALCADSPAELDDDLTSHDLIVLDPCAGGDSEQGMAYPEAIEKFNQTRATPADIRPLDVQIMATVDVREDSRATFKADYLQWNGMAACGAPDIVITNPPFSIALEVIQKALRDVRDDGLVIMLQRLNFFGSKSRAAWFKQNMPVLTYVHSRRMKFHQPGAVNPVTGRKLTGDSIEYAHFVWKRGVQPRWSKLRVL